MDVLKIGGRREVADVDWGKEERMAEPKVKSRLGGRCGHGPAELSLYLIPYLSMGRD